MTASKLNFKGVTVPSANHANSATNADHAASSDSATNAANLGGAPASALRAAPAVGRWWQPPAQSSLSRAGSRSTTHASNGQYFVDFGTSLANRPVSVVLHDGDGGITGDASARPCGGSAVPGGFDCSFVTGVNDAQHLFVRTQDNTGGNVPFGFYVTVGT